MQASTFIKRTTAAVMAVAMLVSMAACAKQESVEAPAGNQSGSIQLQQAQPEQQVQTEKLPTEYTREDMELIVDLMGGGQSAKDMTDEELNKVVEELVQSAVREEAAEIIDLTAKPDSQLPAVDVTENEGAYDEDGAMNTPFDQVYPELIEKEQVSFSGESILVKMKNDTLTDGLKTAGVGALETIVPLEGCAWYEAKLTEGTDAQEALAAVRELDEVVLAEYNYEIKTAAIDDYKHFDKDKDEEFKKNGHNKDQWHFHYVGIPDGYEQMQTEGGDSSVIVAVIDTGVDYDHEDLKDNMWFNAAEIPNNDIDDDKNGYIDDYYGIDLIAGKGSADDDNGHGTHVAGIIAARNNNVGVLGIAYSAKIMPIKAAMHNGTLNQADIAKAVLYAYEMGAEVINMSFGGSACSIAVQDALAVAYSRSVLVASAGNSGKPNEVSDHDDMPLPNYPAALSYVLGVMSVDENGVESAFSNWDTKAFNGVEYELYAPGESIMSTLPNDQYGFLTGTSMAAPIVSAMAAILRSEFTDRDMYPTSFIYGQLSSTSDYYAECIDPEGHAVNGMMHNLPQIVNLNAALTKLPKPEVGMQDYAIFDSKDLSDKNNGDGVIDAGETIALGLTLRNRWGMSGNTLVTIDTLENGIADPYVTIVNPTVDYGSVGTYSTQDCGKLFTGELHTGWKNPFILKIAEDIPNDYRMTFHVTVTCENALDEADTATYESTGDIDLTARNGVVLPSVIDEDMTLTADNLYIIPNATVIQEGVTVRVEPGTHIQFWSDDASDPYADSYIAYLLVNGSFLVEGTREDPVYIYPSQLMDRYGVEIGSGKTGFVSMQYADITNFFYCRNAATEGHTGTHNKIDLADHCSFRWSYSDGLQARRISGGAVTSSNAYPHIGTINAKDCVFYKIACRGSGDLMLYGEFDRCIFNQCGIIYTDAKGFRDCVFLGNGLVNQTDPGVYLNSTITLEKPELPGAESLHVYYRAETGTTYIHWDSAGLGVEKHAEAVRDYIQKTYGGDYVVVQTQDEYDWLDGIGRARFVAGFEKGPDGTYFWSDGTPVAEEFLPVQITSSYGRDSTIYLYDGNLKIGSYDWIMYEIPGQILPTEITLPEYAVTMDTGYTYQLSPVNTPVQLPLNSFLYESTDEAVVTVSDTGLVTPVGEGTADVWVYSLDKAVKNYVSFAVKAYVPLEGVSFSQETVTLAAGDTLAAPAVLTPANTTRRNVTYSSSNEAVATVNAAGVVTATGSGTATITATCEGITAEMTVNVFTMATSLNIDVPGITAPVTDGTVQLPTVTPSEGGEPLLQWSVMDPLVARVADGALELLKPGITTLTVTDIRSGVTDSVTVYVTEEDTPRIKQISNSSVPLLLMDNGDVYRHSGERILQNVKAMDGTWFALEDNTLIDSSGMYTITAFQDYDIAEFSAYNQAMAHILTTDGKVYAYGAYDSMNNHGQLGIGTTTAATEPTLVSFNEPVVQVEYSGSTTVYYLTQSGNLYVSGGINLKASVPQLVARNVTWLDEDGRMFVSNGYFAEFTDYDTEAWISTISLEGYEILDSGSNQSYRHAVLAKKDGQVYYYDLHFRSGDGWYGIYEERKVFSCLDNVIAGISTGINGVYRVVTADGLLYGATGPTYSGASNSFAGMTIESTIDLNDPILLPVIKPAEMLYLLGSNLDEENVLTGQTLQLQFSKELLKNGATLYENGTAISSHTEMSGNVLAVTCSVGFVEGVSYQLVIAAAKTTGLSNVVLAEDLVIDFTYVPAAQEGEVPGETTDETTGEAPEDTQEETVIHESQLDETVERILTPESVSAKLTAYCSETQRNNSFIGNAILNPITTDTQVTHWLRPTAPTASTYTEIALGGNWWGTTSETAIGLQMFDYTDMPTYARLMYEPFLTEAPENTFPFVTAVKLINKAGEEVTTVGNEEVTFRVTFNRDMDTAIPLRLTFGSAYPYGDYEIEGQYVDARTWEGVYTLNTLIANGDQYVTISNGCSATDDLELQLDQARFGFVIDTTAAQALTMQGTASDTGIQLKWTQDDFDTLMGYNVYRATKEDGLYTRLNSTVIPTETMEWFDDTVEPGVVYYYNFTVVKTDLTESEPSGKIAIMSKDTMAPDIYHSPVANAFAGTNLVVSATVTDNLSIAYANLYYRVAGTDGWKTIRMNALNDKYSAIIPAADITLAGVEYYIEAFDGVSLTYKGAADTPYTIAVQETVDADSLGDVDGDGVITNRDALVLLYAINDKYNMSAEEFARADLNGDGELWAAEALRILQYVSGVVGSVKLS